MSALRKRFVEDLTLRNYARRTIETYTRHVACFARHFGRSPEVLGPEEIRSYQLYLIQEKRASWSTFNQAVCALRFLYRITLPRDWAVTMIAYAKKPKTLPSVLGAEEVEKLLACAQPVKPRLVLATLYAAGLRLDEALHLQPADIDSSRMLLHVRQGKGSKQRMVPLSQRLLTELREYWQASQPRVWLFPGADGQRPLDPATVQKACGRAALAAGLQKHVTPHTLRHSYATSLAERGENLLTIQALLGHRSLSTTQIYLHLRRPHLSSIVSPFDYLPRNLNSPPAAKPNKPDQPGQDPEAPLVPQ
jgi:integrase/recombinase XerD